MQQTVSVAALEYHMTNGEATAKPRVLDVGQCDFDHGNLSQLLTHRFGTTVDRAHSLDEAFAAVKSRDYDLVLVNRIFDADKTEGLDLVRRLKNDPATRVIPVMLISNFAEAQKAAAELGAVPGFGKDALASETTVELLARCLRRNETNGTLATNEEIPKDYERFLIEEVRVSDDRLTLRYGGRTFGGVLREWLRAPGVEAAVVPGAEILVRNYRSPSGQRGQVEHMLVRTPADGWAEIYADTD